MQKMASLVLSIASGQILVQYLGIASRVVDSLDDGGDGDAGAGGGGGDADGGDAGGGGDDGDGGGPCHC